MGSGSLNAMAVFEASYKEDMTQQEAESLVARAIRSGASKTQFCQLVFLMSSAAETALCLRKC